MTSLEASIKQRALAEGFDLVGIAASGAAQTSSHLEQWLKLGMHGTMSFMSTTAPVRTDPSLVLADCRSIIAVAMSYHTSQPSSSDSADPQTAWISRYAWGRDYHKLMKKKLIRLGRWLSEATNGCAWRACVDTVPVLEREWAHRAGLGWIGKNTMLLNRKLGSELFLALLLVDEELEPDSVKPDHCGRCTACIEACPTSALIAPRVLDARRCIAYLSIEHKGEISEDLRPMMGNMVAGCDICQEVCPWTRRAHADLHPEFAPTKSRFRPQLDLLESQSEEEYRTWRAGSALNRISFARFRRNLSIARQNQNSTPEAAKS
ncbi:MAG: tRNA epoxyqueuosine(34) reductase QueG [bacterium]|nr:tRNA epoxyqueuosine(34) reductase QueG [bacterium]